MEPHHVVTSIAGILQLLLIAQVLGSVGTVLLTVVFHNLALRSIGQIKAPDPAPGFIVQVCLKFEGVEAVGTQIGNKGRVRPDLSASALLSGSGRGWRFAPSPTNAADSIVFNVSSLKKVNTSVRCILFY